MNLLVLAAAAVSAVHAALPVYLRNADAVAPAHTVLEFGAADALARRFVGLDVGADPAAPAAADLVPSVLGDARNAAVVVLANFDLHAAEAALGSPLLYVAPPPVGAAGDEARRAAPAPGALPAGAAAESALAALDVLAWPVVAVDAAGAQDALLGALAALESKVLIVGVPAGEPVPDLPWTAGGAALHKQRRAAPGSAPAVSPAGKRAGKAGGLHRLPAMFASQEECEDRTGACSGRGSCVARGKLWACACKPTKDGKYTLHWGGPACSKRDVSWQFSLIVWTTIGIVGAATAVVLMLFKVGSEPLPGILNTGVTL